MLISAALLAALAAPGDVAREAYPADAPIRARPIALDLDAPARVRIGALIYRGGWVLSGDNPRFGGLSAMTIVGHRVLGVSDAGYVLAFTFSDGVVRDPYVAPLPTIGRNANKRDRDTESLTIDPVGGRLWIGTEFHNHIWRFAPGFASAEASAGPRAMRDWPPNGGPEAMARLADGRFIVLSERAPAAGGMREALLFARDPTASDDPPLRFRYRPPAGYDPSDAAALPDGRVAILNRRASFTSGFAAVLTVIDPAAIRRGEAIEGRVLARLAPPLTVDNFEALAVTREHGRTMLWIASDDNFTLLQRTLLMKFELVGLRGSFVLPQAPARASARLATSHKLGRPFGLACLRLGPT